MRGMGGAQKELFVRLKKDGTVEWETMEERGAKLHASKVDAQEVLAIEQRLDEIDQHAILPRMGAYNVYIDTSVELRIRIVTSKWNRRFSVSNPWPGLPPKPLPQEVKVVLCEMSELRSQVANEAAVPLCTERAAPHN